MKTKTLYPFVGILLLAMALIGCSQPPQQELEAAQASLDSAFTMEASVYAADLYLAAQDSFEAAQVEIEAQNAKSALSRNYDHAAALLQFATQTATQAQEQVVVRKEEVRIEADDLIFQAQEAVTMAEQLLGTAPRGKEGAIALVSIQQDVSTALASLDSARAAQATGKYAEARDFAKSALDQANGLITEMNDAIAKTTSPRS